MPHSCTLLYWCVHETSMWKTSKYTAWRNWHKLGWTPWPWSKECLVTIKPHPVLIAPWSIKQLWQMQIKNRKEAELREAHRAPKLCIIQATVPRRRSGSTLGENSVPPGNQSTSFGVSPPGTASQLWLQELGQITYPLWVSVFPSSVNWQRENIPSRIVNVKMIQW